MKKVFRKLIVTLFLIIMVAQVPILSFATPNIPKPTRDFYVNDFANVFTDDEKAALMNRAVDLANTTDGIQVVITTIKSLDGNIVGSYATEMYNQYGIGRNKMGILILLATEDRKIRVEVGKSMESYVTDSKAGYFTDKYAISKLKQNKFNEGLISLQTELIREIKNCIEKEKAKQSATPETPREPISIDWGAVVFTLISLIILGIFVIIVIGIYKKSKKIQELEQENARLIEERRVVQEDASRKIESVREETKSIIRQRQELTTRCDTLNDEFTKLKDRYRRVNLLYPSADKDVSDMIEEEIRQQDMAKAAKVNSVILQSLSLTADKSVVSQLRQALDSYNALTKKQKEYVDTDVEKLKKLYEESMQLNYKYLAGVAVVAITGIIASMSIGKEQDIRELNQAKDTYERLDSEAKKYVDKSIPGRLSQLLLQAQHDKKEREEREEAERRRRRRQEEERRRQESYNNNHFDGGSSGSSGGYSGFGGESGGGGASRDF